MSEAEGKIYVIMWQVEGDVVTSHFLQIFLSIKKAMAKEETTKRKKEKKRTNLTKGEKKNWR